MRVKCSDNVFYDLSDVDLTVDGTLMSPPISLGDTDFTTYSFANGLITTPAALACGAVVVCTTPAEDDNGEKSGDSSGALDYLWLLMMTGIIALVKFYRRYG